MRITRATFDDTSELCVLLEYLFTQEAEFTPNHTLIKHGLTSIINNSNVGDIFIARKGGEIVGMISLLYTISTALGGRVAILEDMIVSPNARGLGIGSSLIHHSINFAKKNNCRRITLLTDHDNESAQRFYQNHGFIRSSMIVFRKLLDSEIIIK